MSRKSSSVAISQDRAKSIQARNIMTGDLVLVFERVSKLIREAASKTLGYYMKLGKEIVAVEDDIDSYGSDALNLLAKALIVHDEGTLRRAAKVRRILTDADLDWIEEKNREQMENGEGIVHWSHLHTLSYIGDRKKFLGFLKIVYERGMSVRELRDLIGEDTPERAEGAVSNLPVGLLKSTDNISARSSALFGIIDKYSEFFSDEDTVRDAVNDPKFRAKAEEAAVNLRKLGEQAISNADALMKSLIPPEAAAAAPPAAPIHNSPDPERTRRPM